MADISYKQKLIRILGVSGWSRDKLADLLGVSNNSLGAWVRGGSAPHAGHAGRVDGVYEELVGSLICKIEARADKVEKRLLSERIEHLPDNNACGVD
jgi:transcriptional regulator with XRE-family HTH domain